jgi:Protein of unknown function (DUF1569)
MKNLYESVTVDEVKKRIAQVGPGSLPQWGKMSAAQAMAHCSAGLEWAVGDTVPPRMLIGSIIGRFVKPKVLGNEEPMRRNSPTAKTLVIQDDRNLGTEKERLSGLIDRFAASGPERCTRHPHSFFGPLTPQEWALLMYKHLDHHLRQFGA